MLRVLVAEDSPTDQELLVAVLESDSEIRVVGRADDGMEAVELARRLRPDLVTMDIFMPRLDGFEATREIMISAPTPIMLVSSSAGGREVELSMKAMEVGALTVVAKPGHVRAPGFDEERARFLATVKAMSQVRVVRRWPDRGSPTAAVRARAARPSNGTPRLIAIGASTGGPAAVRRILGDLPNDLPVPVLVVQHMARGFTAGLVSWLGTSCGLPVKIAQHGEPLVGGTVFVAPDDSHLALMENTIDLTVHPELPEAFQPSANVLFESVARAYGSGVLAVILTGMGSDGVKGLQAVRAAGGMVLAQDEATSVIYGMPREASMVGAVNEELPLDEIGPRLTQLAVGGKHGDKYPAR
jgi:two-component system, chemotaxis family, protein-glutamate methylesterase/glutaminase